jgi:hypothetical protein
VDCTPRGARLSWPRLIRRARRYTVIGLGIPRCNAGTERFFGEEAVRRCVPEAHVWGASCVTQTDNRCFRAMQRSAIVQQLKPKHRDSPYPPLCGLHTCWLIVPLRLFCSTMGTSGKTSLIACAALRPSMRGMTKSKTITSGRSSLPLRPPPPRQRRRHKSPNQAWPAMTEVLAARIHGRRQLGFASTQVTCKKKEPASAQIESLGKNPKNDV